MWGARFSYITTHVRTARHIRIWDMSTLSSHATVKRENFLRLRMLSKLRLYDHLISGTYAVFIPIG